MKIYTVKETLMTGTHLGTQALILGAMATATPIVAAIMTGIIGFIGVRNYLLTNKLQGPRQQKRPDKKDLKDKFNAMADYIREKTASLGIDSTYNLHFASENNNPVPDAKIGRKIISYNETILNEDQATLNSITSHEIAHDLANHELAWRVSTAMTLATLGTAAIGAVSLGINSDYAQALSFIVTAPLAFLFPSSLARAHEYQADRLGADIYGDTRPAIEAFERWKEFAPSDLPVRSFTDSALNAFSNAVEMHPHPQKRIDALQRHAKIQKKSGLQIS